MRLMWWSAFWVAFAGAFIGAPVAMAQTTPAVAEPPARETVLEGDAAFAVAIQLFVRNGEYQKALDLLLSRPDILDKPEGLRLRVELLLRLGRDAEALGIIELYLSAHPDDAVARYQLGEIHYQRRHDQAAAFAFRLALAGKLDAMRTQMAQARLENIQARKRWRVWIGGAISPDSNLNSGTDATYVDLFGLPFKLDEAARRRTGIGVTAHGGVERRFILSPRLALRASAVASLNDVPGNDADTANLTLRLGPEWRIGPTSSLSMQAKAGQRWFGGAVYETSNGVALEGETYGRDRRWTGALTAEAIDARLNPGRDGHSYSLELSRTRFLGPSSLWRVAGIWVRRDADAAPEAYNQGQLSLGRLFRGPLASFIYAETSLSRRRFDGQAVAFGIRREDKEASLEVRLSKRDWLIAGMHPYVAVSSSRTDSSISLYSYDRNRMEFGLTREF